jgi:hypothetical protein
MLTIATLYAITGLAWLVCTGRLAHAQRGWDEGGAEAWKRVVALCVAMVVWPVWILLAWVR